MRTYLVSFYFGAILIGSIGCMRDSWYDIKSSKSQAVPTSLKDLQSLLDNASIFNAWSPISNENASDSHFFGPSIVRRLKGVEYNSYFWTKEQPNINVSDWFMAPSGSYGKIYAANLVLEALDKIGAVDKVDESILNSIRGQALFFRAKTYFELSQVFSPPYSKNNIDDKLGVPIRLETDLTIKSIRSTIGETFNQIVNDLKVASTLLPSNQDFKTRPSKNACLAMLARVYLSVEQYEESRLYADLALKNYSYLLDYNLIDYNSLSNPFQGYNDETIFYSYISGGTYFVMNFININEELYNSYSEYDLRKKAYFNFDNSSNLISYKGSYAGVGFDYFFSGLATDELYLIRAECSARKGEVESSMNDLNTLMRKRWHGPYTNISVSSAEEALAVILAERRKELVLRGVRWSDLRRLNRDPRFAQTFTRSFNSKTYSLEPNSYQYTFPIPEDIIQFTNMQQNPGWE